MAPITGAGKERSDVYSLSHLYVAALQNEKITDAANERLAGTPAASKVELGAALKSVWSLLSGPAERPMTPTLTNYPYRG
jgi:hypothetical protein